MIWQEREIVTNFSLASLVLLPIFFASLLWVHFQVRKEQKKKSVFKYPSPKAAFIFFVAFWALNIYVGEHLVFTLSFCDFPTLNNGQNVRKVALIADPQIIDRWTYEHIPQGLFFEKISILLFFPKKLEKKGIATKVAQFFCDYYERKSFKQVQHAEPHVVYFVGDLFWGSHLFVDYNEFLSSWKRYNWIFTSREDLLVSKETMKERKFMLEKMEEEGFHISRDEHTRIPMLNLTGNHDMGMFTGGVNMKNRTELQKFYLTHFGKWNHKIRLSKWDVLSLSSPHMEDTFSMHQQYKKQTFDFVFAQNQTGFFHFVEF